MMSDEEAQIRSPNLIGQSGSVVFRTVVFLCGIIIAGTLVCKVLPQSLLGRIANKAHGVFGFSTTNQSPVPEIEIESTRPLSPPVSREDPRWYQPLVADPFPLGSHKTLYVYGNGGSGGARFTTRLSGELIDWSNNSDSTVDLSTLPVRRNNKGALERYTIVSNQSGIWFVGPVIALLQGDGVLHSIEYDLPPAVTEVPASRDTINPLAIGLNDGSLLVLTKLRSDDKGHIFLVKAIKKFGDVTLAMDELHAGPPMQDDSAAIKLSDGRVLLVGGRYYFEQRAQLFDPVTLTWTATGSTNRHRTNVALTALPDGRAVVVGAASSEDQAAVVGNTAEIWDPATGKWSLLPPLPLSFQVVADGAHAPSIAVLPDGSLVVAGGMHQQVVMLKNNGKTFASYWLVVGSTTTRAGGIVQALSNSEVVVSGGVDVTSNHQCCWYRGGGDRVAWRAADIVFDKNILLESAGVAIAHRGSLSFAAGGAKTYFYPFTRVQGSAVTILIDWKTRKTTELPPLPELLLSGDAMWVDDKHVVVKGVRKIYENGFEVDSRSVEPVTHGLFAELDLNTMTWRALSDRRIDECRLAGTLHDEALLVCPTAEAYSVSLGPEMSITELPRLISTHRFSTMRVTADGRVIVAGGLSQHQLFEALDAECDAPDCPVRWFSRGSIAPSQRYEILDASPGAAWHLSAPSTGEGSSAVIRADGRVVKLGFTPIPNRDDENAVPNYTHWDIEQSEIDGSAWRPLPLPSVFQAGDLQNAPCGKDPQSQNCELMSADIPGTTQTIVFLVQCHPVQYQWNQRYDVWVFNDNENVWQLVTQGIAADELDEPQRLPFKSNGAVLKAAMFEPGHVRLWTEIEN